MGPEEIILAETPAETPGTPTGNASKSVVVAPILISAEVFDRIEKSESCSTFENRRVFGNTAGIADFGDIPIYYYCRCVQWDLTKPESRAAYGELLGKTLELNSPISLLWQERVVDGEKLILYLTYSEQVRIVELK